MDHGQDRARRAQRRRGAVDLRPGGRGARHWAAGAVGSALDVVSDLAGWDWLQNRFAEAADTYANLPLTDIYHFTTKTRNSIDEWFKDVDARLMGVPFYPEFREWVSQRLDGLRESLKEVIKTALKAAADLIKAAFGESVAEGSNIHAQIESAVQSQIKNAEARAEYEAASHEQKVALLADPGWCSRARITRSDAEHLSAMIQTPEWAQEGPSHSQIAKDHADSPFFGTAAALAMHADTHLRDLIVAVWSAEGRNTTDPALAGNYASEIDPKLQAIIDNPNSTAYERRHALREAQKNCRTGTTSSAAARARSWRAPAASPRPRRTIRARTPTPRSSAGSSGWR